MISFASWWCIREGKEEKYRPPPLSKIKTTLLLFLIALAVFVAPDSRATGRAEKSTRAPQTDEQKQKFKEELKERVDKLSPEAQAAHEKIMDAYKAFNKAIEEIKAPLAEPVKKELENLMPKRNHYEHKDGHKGHHHDGQGRK